MSVILRVPESIRQELLADLRRPHPHASERVAFAAVRLGNAGGDPALALVTDWWPIPDEHYVEDEGSGARIGREAIRNAMQRILDQGTGVLHVHLHEFAGVPAFGRMDDREIPRLVDSFVNTNPAMPHGMLVLSPGSATARVALPSEPLREAQQITFVGYPTTLTRLVRPRDGARFSRQSFLGLNSSAILASATVGIIGLGGGGSHIVQQLAHLGFQRFVLYDAQEIESTNLNRLVGATEADIRASRRKVDIAERLVKGIREHASVQKTAKRWQDEPRPLRSCDLVFGCVDGFDERRQLETTCRRYLIPLVDIGMDVHTRDGQAPRLVGQVLASVPGHPCMQCLGFLNERTLTEEAQRYGDAGEQPQVVWSNGVLASTAVGVGVDLLTNWRRRGFGPIYLSYDGNKDTLMPHVRLDYIARDLVCNHHRLNQAGDPSL